MKAHTLTTAYDLRDATWEIVIMLAVAFILGYLFRKFWHEAKTAPIVPIVPKIAAPTAAYAPAPLVQIAPSVTPIDPTVVMGRLVVQDDLKIVEGIGPKIEEILHIHNILTWSDLAGASQERLMAILSAAGDRFKMHNPSSWVEQAALARDGKWNELKEYQDYLTAGRE